MQTSENNNPAETAAKVRGLQDENRDEANSALPGGRAAKPEGSIRPTETAPHSDEHRDQPVAPAGGLTKPAPGPTSKE
ncbi:MAG: hypothetical protein JOZ42_04610 [Acetobacteraceae bacterium]|nr:hypothetical protein [Acetobacteraceae bacterium]